MFLPAAVGPEIEIVASLIAKDDVAASDVTVESWLLLSSKVKQGAKHFSNKNFMLKNSTQFRWHVSSKRSLVLLKT